MQQRSDIGLGASEIAAVAGLNPHASPWDVWLAKTGHSNFAGNELTEWGHRLEPAIRQKYADETGYDVVVPRASLFHPDRPWQRATPDGMVWEGVGQDVRDALERACAPTVPPPSRLFQAKNVGEWPGRRYWADGVPDYVQLQEQWEMDVTGAPVADVCGLIGGHEWRMLSVHYDAKIAANLVEIGEAFMRRVAAGTPPDVDASKACAEHFRDRLQKERRIEYHADAEAESVIAEWRRRHLDRSRANKLVEESRNRVRKLFADAGCDRVVWSGGVLRLQESRTKESVDYRAVAELVASAKGMSREELDALIAEYTDTKTGAPILAAPSDWKEK